MLSFISYRKTNGFLKKSVDINISPNFGFNYRWKSDKAISWSLNYSFGLSRFDEHEDFFKIIEEDYEAGCTIMTNLARHYLERLKQTRQESKIYFKTVFRSLHA